jgi:glycosyltransferase involved in cell wall biosynthesis
MKLSICIATHNEEEFIHYPLDSVYDIADEIIIVDGKSEDRTVEIARKYGDKVHVFTEENPPMFHINKQKAIEHANGEWILQLDADEALSPELKKEVMDVISSSNQDKSAYWMPRKNYFLGRFLTKGGIYPDYTIRLYKNGSAPKFSTPIT